ncbi:MAG: hypothetical protein GKS01_09830 [Alphaproteobacteria bacterium]|nr:hypothetical protein [Alphaproteobacteria bacterium]
MDVELPQEMEDRIASISDEELEFRGWTRESMREGYSKRVAEDVNSPQVGDAAPDFQLERLGPAGERTGEQMSLSSLRGKPVGLIFGSYT